ncbi:divergent PAP2 family protein [Patescibacteria group bacterium]|jgi:acid phosphatase family membrane protein YuiD|nr:divergent PAP2 family protein [Patescibacteria group bacterium]
MLIDYQLWLIPFLVMVIAQALKVVFTRSKTWDWNRLKRFNQYGGMPSSHSAMVTSLVTVLAYDQGISAPSFAVAVILALITIRDASGFRLAIGQHGQMINQLVKELPDEQEYKFPILGEKFGHKTTEVIGGVIFGLLCTLLLIQIF